VTQGAAIDPTRRAYFANSDSQWIYRFDFDGGTWSRVVCPFFRVYDVAWLAEPSGVLLLGESHGFARYADAREFVNVTPRSGRSRPANDATCSPRSTRAVQRNVDGVDRDHGRPRRGAGGGPVNLDVLAAPDIEILGQSVERRDIVDSASQSLHVFDFPLPPGGVAELTTTVEGHFQAPWGTATVLADGTPSRNSGTRRPGAPR